MDFEQGNDTVGDMPSYPKKALLRMSAPQASTQPTSATAGMVS